MNFRIKFLINSPFVCHYFNCFKDIFQPSSSCDCHSKLANCILRGCSLPNVLTLIMVKLKHPQLLNKRIIYTINKILQRKSNVSNLETLKYEKYYDHYLWIHQFHQCLFLVSKTKEASHSNQKSCLQINIIRHGQLIRSHQYVRKNITLW